MKKLFILSVALLGLAACRRDAIETTPTNNSQFTVELLFENDGCKVYRFYDHQWIYYTTCDGSVQWEEKHGKSYEQEQVNTSIK